MKLSIVATMYYSAPYISEFFRRISAAAQNLVGDSYEIILVNDGSPDSSFDVAVGLKKSNANLKIVDLSRNFGHHKAIMAGLSHASGERVFLIDIDLEESPELVLGFWSHMDQVGCDMVYGVQLERKGLFFERLSGSVFYSIINFLSNIDIPKNQLVARLMTKKYLASLLSFPETEIFLAGMYEVVGFDKRPFFCEKTNKGTTTYTFSRKIKQAVDAITSFSSFPLVFMFYLGAFILLATIIYSGHLICNYFVSGSEVSGWLSLALLTSFFSGLMVFCLGVVGIYISKIYSEVKRRPLTTVKDVL